MITLPTIPPFDEKSADLARQRQDRLTKPTGSLGRLEALSVQLAGVFAQARPLIKKKSVIVMAADHGVAHSGVSAYPAEVTPQMVMNFLNGGAAINVLSRQAGARVITVDIGVDYDFAPTDGLLQRKVAYGTKNFAEGPAMTPEQTAQAIQTGIEIANSEIDDGVNLIVTGEMGIGNTSSSAAITAAITGLPVAQCTGRGTGLDDTGLSRKIQVIEQGLKINRPDTNDAFDVLAKVGGLEIAGITGTIIAAAAKRVPVMVDGFISGAAALVAAEMLPAVRPYLIAGHRSVEIGQSAILERLELTPLLDLDMRLGEGTGAVLATHLVEAAALILDEMATFDEAGVHSVEQE